MSIHYNILSSDGDLLGVLTADTPEQAVEEAEETLVTLADMRPITAEPTPPAEIFNLDSEIPTETYSCALCEEDGGLRLCYRSIELHWAHEEKSWICEDCAINEGVSTGLTLAAHFSADQGLA